MSITPPSVGIHAGVPFETYREWPAINISALKSMRRSPFHFRWDLDHVKESDEMDVGSAVHVSILEPARLDKEFYFGKEEYRANTKEGKIIQAKEISEAAGRRYIRRMKGEAAVDGDDVKGIAESVWKFKAPRKFLEMPGQTEVSALWKDPITGELCKGRFDKLISGIILEIKTCRDARLWEFGKQCNTLAYNAQAAWYQWGYEVLTRVKPIHIILALENKGPYATNVWSFDDPDLNTGALQIRDWLNLYAECKKKNHWPAYGDEVDVLKMPEYANRYEAMT